MGGETWKRFVAIGVGGVALCALASGDGQALVGAVVQVASIVAVLVAIRTWRPSESRAWYCFVAGGSSIVLGGVVLSVHSALAGVSNPFPSPADALFILGYVGLIAGEVILVRRRSAD
ncbi:MAG TPA: hypothetical protein VEI97_00395, partial [bacterium]|nr:hypothetical protein [bacterium]